MPLPKADDVDLDKMCLEMKDQNLAMVNVIIGTPTLIRNRRQLVASFETRLGTIGGTLSLFLGMSILSMIEVGFWIGKYLWRCVQDLSIKCRL